MMVKIQAGRKVKDLHQEIIIIFYADCPCFFLVYKTCSGRGGVEIERRMHIIKIKRDKDFSVSFPVATFGRFDELVLVPVFR